MHPAATHSPVQSLAQVAACRLGSRRKRCPLRPRETQAESRGESPVRGDAPIGAHLERRPLEANEAEVIRLNPLNKATRSRVIDVLNRIFVPRLIDGPIPDAWKLVAPLARLGAPARTVRPIYYWLTALAEPLLYDFYWRVPCREACLRSSVDRRGGSRRLDRSQGERMV